MSNKTETKNLVESLDNALNASIKDLVEMEKNSLEEQAKTVLEERLSFIEDAVEETVHTVDNIDKEEQELRVAMKKIMDAKGLVSTDVPVLFFTKDNGWREVIRKRLVALIECHKPGATYNVKIHDLEFKEFKTVRTGNSKVQVEVAKETAIAKYVSMLMADSKDTSEKLNDGSYKITPAKSPAAFIIKAPTVKKPILQICFDMDK